MINEIAWAACTGAVTGGAWVARLARGYLRRSAMRQQALITATILGPQGVRP